VEYDLEGIVQGTGNENSGLTFTECYEHFAAEPGPIMVELDTGFGTRPLLFSFTPGHLVLHHTAYE